MKRKWNRVRSIVAFFAVYLPTSLYLIPMLIVGNWLVRLACAINGKHNDVPCWIRAYAQWYRRHFC